MYSDDIAMDVHVFHFRSRSHEHYKKVDAICTSIKRNTSILNDNF